MTRLNGNYVYKKHRIHFGLNETDALCNVQLYINDPALMRLTENEAEVSCVNCKKRLLAKRHRDRMTLDRINKQKWVICRMKKIIE
jgi:hypothetical protein